MKCCDKDLEFKLIKDREGFNMKEASKCQKCSTSYLKKAGSNIIYKSKDNNDWNCASCGSEIVGASVSHSLHDPNFTCAGGGSVITEFVPYCPNCEKKPNPNGSPVYESRQDLF